MSMSTPGRGEKEDPMIRALFFLVRLVLFFFFSKLPDPRIISNFQNYRSPTPNTIVFLIIFCAIANENCFKNYLGDHFGPHGLT